MNFFRVCSFTQCWSAVWLWTLVWYTLNLYECVESQNFSFIFSGAKHHCYWECKVFQFFFVLRNLCSCFIMYLLVYCMTVSVCDRWCHCVSTQCINNNPQYFYPEMCEITLLLQTWSWSIRSKLALIFVHRGTVYCTDQAQNFFDCVFSNISSHYDCTILSALCFIHRILKNVKVRYKNCSNWHLKICSKWSSNLHPCSLL